MYEHLLRNYHANLRPVKVHTEVVNVTVDLGLTQIINMVIEVNNFDVKALIKGLLAKYLMF